MTIVKGWNLIATPLTITSSPNFGENMNQAIGPDFTNGDQLWDYIDGNWDHINFGTSWDNKFNPERGNGYWLNITDLPEGQTTRKLTIIGDANMQTYSRQIKNGWNLIAGPYPQDLVDTETNFVMPGPADGDQLWSYLNGWDHINYAISSGVGDWSISPATTIPEKPEMKIELKAGQGYWYNNVGTGFRWQPKK
jgi:hypothetical protein